MGKYFNQMKQDLEIRGYSSSTVRIYLDHMKNFIKFHMKSPEDILLEDITAYQVYLVYSKKASFATFNLAVCSIKYFFNCQERTCLYSYLQKGEFQHPVLTYLHH